MAQEGSHNRMDLEISAVLDFHKARKADIAEKLDSRLSILI